MFYQLRCWLGFPPQNPTAPHLEAGHPPLMGRDRWHNPLPPDFIKNLHRSFNRTVGYWIRSGCPIIPKRTMHTRSVSFAILVLSVFALGMILPEILGLTHPYPLSAYPYLP